MPSELLGPVSLDRSKFMIGESVRVDATRPDAKPWNGEEDFPITVNGVHGSVQFLQFSAPGKREIRVAAEKGGHIEERSIEVTVTDRSEPKQAPKLGQELLLSDRLSLVPPLLHVQRAQRSPYKVAISVGAKPFDAQGLIDAPVDAPVGDHAQDVGSLPVWAKESLATFVTKSPFAAQSARTEAG